MIDLAEIKAGRISDGEIYLIEKIVDSVVTENDDVIIFDSGIFIAFKYYKNDERLGFYNHIHVFLMQIYGYSEVEIDEMLIRLMKTYSNLNISSTFIEYY